MRKADGKAKSTYKVPTYLLRIIRRFKTHLHTALRGLGYVGSGAVPVDCTEAEHLIRTDTCLHSVLWNETGDTSSVRGSPDTEKHPVNTKHHSRRRVTKGGDTAL